MLNVLFDFQIFKFQKSGGISRYIAELLLNLPQFDCLNIIENIETENAFYQSLKEQQLTHSLSIPQNAYFKLSKTFSKQKYRNKLNAQSIFYLTHMNYDIFHPTYYHPYFLDHVKSPYVVTVHDMIHEKFASIYPELDSVDSAHKKTVLKNAAHVITVSNNTKKDLMDIFNIPDSKITPIHLASSFPTAAKILDAHTRKPYLLFVGNRGFYKNFNLFMTAVAPILIKDTNLWIQCIGGGEFTLSEQSLMETLGITKQVKLALDVSEETLSTYYQDAQAFVFPTLYEGFGLPVLEAFANNCPVLCSNVSSLPEVAGNAAAYFNPKDKDDIQSCISSVLYNGEKQTALIQAGQAQLSKFSWKKTAELTNEVYKSICQ